MADPTWKALLETYGNDVMTPTVERDPERRFVELLNFITAAGAKLEVDGASIAPLAWGMQLSTRPPLGALPTTADFRPKLYTGTSVVPLSAASFAQRTSHSHVSKYALGAPAETTRMI